MKMKLSGEVLAEEYSKKVGANMTGVMQNMLSEVYLSGFNAAVSSGIAWKVVDSNNLPTESVFAINTMRAVAIGGLVESPDGDVAIIGSLRKVTHYILLSDLLSLPRP